MSSQNQVYDQIYAQRSSGKQCRFHCFPQIAQYYPFVSESFILCHMILMLEFINKQRLANEEFLRQVI
jgi:hypothetical protein